MCFWEYLSFAIFLINERFYLSSCSIVSFESVDEILKCDHSNESYGAVLSRVQGGSNFESVDEIIK